MVQFHYFIIKWESFRGKPTDRPRSRLDSSNYLPAVLHTNITFITRYLQGVSYTLLDRFMQIIPADRARIMTLFSTYIVVNFTE